MPETYVGQISPEYKISFQLPDKRLDIVFTRPTFETEKAYTIFLENRGLNSILRHRKDLPPAMLREQMEGWREDMQIGKFHWLTPLSLQSLDSLECLEELLYYVMCQKPEQGKSVDRKTFHDICYSKSHVPIVTASGEVIDHYVISELKGALTDLINSPNFTPEYTATPG